MVCISLQFVLKLVTAVAYIEWCEEATERRRFTFDKCNQYPFVYPYPDCYCLNGIALIKVAYDSRQVREISFGKDGCFSHKALGAPNRTIELLSVEFEANETLVGYDSLKEDGSAKFEFLKVPMGSAPMEFSNNTLVIYNGELYDTNEDYNDKSLYCIQKNSNQDTYQQVRYYQLYPDTYIWLNATCDGGNYVDLELISAGKLLTAGNQKCIPKCGKYNANTPIRVPNRMSGLMEYSNSEEFGLEKSCKPIPNQLIDLHKDLNERILKHSIERSFYDQQSYKIDYKPSYSFKVMELLSKITSKYCRHARIPSNFFEQALEYFKIAHEGRGFYFSEDFSFADYNSISRMLRRCLFYMNETIQFTSEGCGVTHNIKSVFRDSPKVDGKGVHPSATHQYFDHHVVLDIPWNMLDLANVVCVNAFSKSYRMYHLMEQGIEKLFTSELRSFWLYPDVPNFYYENLYGPYWRSFARNLEKCVDSAYMYNPKMSRLIRPQWIPGNQRSSRRRGTTVDPICERRRSDLELISQNYEIYCAGSGKEPGSPESRTNPGSGELAIGKGTGYHGNKPLMDFPETEMDRGSIGGTGGYAGNKPLMDFPDVEVGGGGDGYTGNKPLMDFPETEIGGGRSDYTGNMPVLDLPDTEVGAGSYTGSKPLMDLPIKAVDEGGGGSTPNTPLVDFSDTEVGGGGYTANKPLVDFPDTEVGGDGNARNRPSGFHDAEVIGAGEDYTGDIPVLDLPDTESGIKGGSYTGNKPLVDLPQQAVDSVAGGYTLNKPLVDFLDEEVGGSGYTANKPLVDSSDTEAGASEGGNTMNKPRVDFSNTEVGEPGEDYIGDIPVLDVPDAESARVGDSYTGNKPMVDLPQQGGGAVAGGYTLNKPLVDFSDVEIGVNGSQIAGSKPEKDFPTGSSMVGEKEQKSGVPGTVNNVLHEQETNEFPVLDIVDDGRSNSASGDHKTAQNNPDNINLNAIPILGIQSGDSPTGNWPENAAVGNEAPGDHELFKNYNVLDFPDKSGNTVAENEGANENLGSRGAAGDKIGGSSVAAGGSGNAGGDGNNHSDSFVGDDYFESLPFLDYGAEIDSRNSNNSPSGNVDPDKDRVYLKWPDDNGLKSDDSNNGRIQRHISKELTPFRQSQPGVMQTAFTDSIDPIVNDEQDLPAIGDDIYKRYVYPNSYQQGMNPLYGNSYSSDYFDPRTVYPVETPYFVNDVGNGISLDRYDAGEELLPYRRNAEPELYYSNIGRAMLSGQSTDHQEDYLVWPEKRSSRDDIKMNFNFDQHSSNPETGQSNSQPLTGFPILDYPDYDPVPKLGNDRVLNSKPTDSHPNPVPLVPNPHPNKNIFIDWKSRNGRTNLKSNYSNPLASKSTSPNHNTFLDWMPKNNQQKTAPQHKSNPDKNVFLNWIKTNQGPNNPKPPKPVTENNIFLNWKTKSSEKSTSSKPEKRNENIFIDWKPQSKQKVSDNINKGNNNVRPGRNAHDDIKIDYPDDPRIPVHKMRREPTTPGQASSSELTLLPGSSSTVSTASYFRPSGNVASEKFVEANAKPQHIAPGLLAAPTAIVEDQPKGSSKTTKRESGTQILTVTNGSQVNDSSYPRFPKNSLKLDTYSPEKIPWKCPPQHSFSALPNNCTHFYTCIPDSDSEDQLLMLLLKCRAAMHFDPNVQDCVPGDCIQHEIDSPPNKMQFVALKIQTGRAEEFSVNCTNSKKMLAIDEDCRTYLVCSNIYGEWYANKYKCPENTHFQEASGCVEGACI